MFRFSCKEQHHNNFLVQYWENCRWADATDQQDLNKMIVELNRAYALHAKLRGCTIEQICETLAKVHDSWQAEISDEEDDMIPFGNLSKKRAIKMTGSLMPGIMETRTQNSASHIPFVQVVIPFHD